MKSKLSLKKVVLIVSLAIILFLAVFLIVLGILNKKPVAAFYKIPEKTKNGIVAVLQKTHTRRNKKSLPYEIVILNDEFDLKTAIKNAKKADILFINKSLNSEYATDLAAKRKTGFQATGDDAITVGMTTSIKNSAIVANNKVVGVPLLIDNYEIDINTQDFANSKLTGIQFWEDLENFATRTKKFATVIFPAGEDDAIVNIFGALVESFLGFDAWNNVVEKLRTLLQENNTSYTSYNDVTKTLIKENGEFYKIVAMLKTWQTEKTIPQNINSFSFKDIVSYMDSGLSSVVFMTLSQHRTLEYKTISDWTSIYYPSIYPGMRHFTSPLVLAVPLSKNKIAKKSISLMADDMQSALSSQTGLAPVQANCGVPDKQADDLRYWVAASGEPLPSLSDAAFTTKAQLKTFANVLRNLIQ